MVTEFAYPLLGGISEHVHFLSSELVALGHDVTVLTSRLRERRGETREVDREMLDRFGYRTERIGNGIPVVSNKSVAHVTMGMPAFLRSSLSRSNFREKASSVASGS